MGHKKLTKVVLSFVLCVGLTDAQYRNEVVKIVATKIASTDFDSKYGVVMFKKALKYRDDGGATESTACNCFLKDLYRDITGVDPDLSPSAKHEIKHKILDYFPEANVPSEFDPQ